MPRPRRGSYTGITVQRPIKNTRLLKNIVIIGGGAGGCCTATELAKTGLYNVYLLEKNQELMRESSDATPGRLGLGFHYADKTTALHFLHVTVDFVKTYGRFRQEIGRNQSHPLRRGRYFIVKDSLVPARDILDTYEAIKQEYAKMVREDPSCEVFGPPKDIYRILDPDEFEADVDMKKIELGIETAEELLDWSRLREFIVDQLERKENRILVLTNINVVRVAPHEFGGYYIDGVNTNHGSAVRIYADFVVNASWYNISKFNDMLGISSACRKRCNRIKAIATVKLPEELVHLPSMFFCMGPFCMFSNKGNGVGMITFAPETNIAVTSSSDELEPKFFRIYHSLSENEKLVKGQHILAGVAKFIPKLRHAKVTKVTIGIIQTYMDEDTIDHGFQIGNLDFIHDPIKGGIAKRNYTGVEEPLPGYIINACMKLIYCLDNAQVVRGMINRN